MMEKKFFYEESKSISLNPQDFRENVIPIEVKKRIVKGKQTKIAYQSLEESTDCLYKSDRDIDAAALMLQVKLSNESTSDKDLEDPKVIEHLKKYVDSRHPRKKLGRVY